MRIKKLLVTICIFIFCVSFTPSYAQKGVNNGVQTYGMPHQKFVTKHFNGYENSRFPRRSYYLPSYCQPGATMYNGYHNPFCNQYLPYGSGFYTNF